MHGTMSLPIMTFFEVVRRMAAHWTLMALKCPKSSCRALRTATHLLQLMLVSQQHQEQMKKRRTLRMKELTVILMRWMMRLRWFHKVGQILMMSLRIRALRMSMSMAISKFLMACMSCLNLQ